MSINLEVFARRFFHVRLIALLLAVAAVAAACGGDDDKSSAGGTATKLRLGYFANVTHAPAVIGDADGTFEKAVGNDVEIEFVQFNSGTEAMEALFADAIDATFIGPSPAITGFAESDGKDVRIVAGTASGGASLVVRDGIDSPEDLEGKTLATPSLGNTQDVALRAWLKEEGYKTDETGGGDVSIKPQENADTLATFLDGQIDGAWVPEPWATRLILEGKGHILVDERDLWPEGEFVTTHLVFATDYLEDNKAIAKGLIEGLVETIDAINEDPAAAQQKTNAGIEKITGKALAEETIAGAWERVTFTTDPIASSLEKAKDDAVDAGLLEEVDLEGIYDLTILNEVLTEAGKEEVASA